MRKKTEGLWVKTQLNVTPIPHSYLSVGLLGDVNVLGSIGLTPPLVVPHLCHQLQVSLWFILLFVYTQTHTLILPEDHAEGETKLLSLFTKIKAFLTKSQTETILTLTLV